MLRPCTAWHIARRQDRIQRHSNFCSRWPDPRGRFRSTWPRGPRQRGEVHRHGPWVLRHIQCVCPGVLRQAHRIQSQVPSRPAAAHAGGEAAGAGGDTGRGPQHKAQSNRRAVALAAGRRGGAGDQGGRPPLAGKRAAALPPPRPRGSDPPSRGEAVCAPAGLKGPAEESRGREGAWQGVRGGGEVCGEGGPVQSDGPRSCRGAGGAGLQSL
mmetsp:Transcript_11077/g.35148  ORF Transcript_11077/g.35148 Transcript_11077/m.35148 type:complete len:212 (-) Transcript_11077:872-1507(-)